MVVAENLLVVVVVVMAVVVGDRGRRRVRVRCFCFGCYLFVVFWVRLDKREWHRPVDGRVSGGGRGVVVVAVVDIRVLLVCWQQAPVVRPRLVPAALFNA